MILHKRTLSTLSTRTLNSAHIQMLSHLFSAFLSLSIFLWFSCVYDHCSSFRLLPHIPFLAVVSILFMQPESVSDIQLSKVSLANFIISGPWLVRFAFGVDYEAFTRTRTHIPRRVTIVFICILLPLPPWLALSISLAPSPFLSRPFSQILWKWLTTIFDYPFAVENWYLSACRLYGK